MWPLNGYDLGGYCSYIYLLGTCVREQAVRLSVYAAVAPVWHLLTGSSVHLLPWVRPNPVAADLMMDIHWGGAHWASMLEQCSITLIGILESSGLLCGCCWALQTTRDVCCVRLLLFLLGLLW